MTGAEAADPSSNDALALKEDSAFTTTAKDIICIITIGTLMVLLAIEWFKLQRCKTQIRNLITNINEATLLDELNADDTIYITNGHQTSKVYHSGFALCSRAHKGLTETDAVGELVKRHGTFYPLNMCKKCKVKFNAK